MIKRILSFFNTKDKEILSSKSLEVENYNNEEIKSLIKDLKDTLHSIPEAKGISAIQIGIPLRICICHWDNKEIIMINPKITKTRGKQIFVEGCLSVPAVFKKIERSQKVWCSYIDENGEVKEIAEGGRMSDIIQHELDHFEGVCKIADDKN